MENDTLQNDEVLCTCTGTKRSLIRELHAKGMDMDAISRYSGAISGCGGCDCEIADYLAALDALAHASPAPSAE